MGEAYAGHEHGGALVEMIEHGLEHLGMPHEGIEFAVEFLADTLNIFLILFIVMTAVSFLQTYLDFEKLQKKLVGLNSVWGYIGALLLGTLSPFCSCTIIPVLIGLLNMGVPIGVSICFLTSASLLNITALVSLFSATTPSFFTMYLVIGVLITLIVSLCMAALFKNKNSVKIYDASSLSHLHHHHHHCEECEHDVHHHHLTVKQRIEHALLAAWEIFKQSWLFILIGVAISAAMAAFLPIDRATEFVTDNGGLSVLVSGLIGLPIHSDIFTILPLIGIFRTLSVPVALTFVTATMAISVPEIVLLSRAFKTKFIAVYTLILFVLCVVFGYAFIIFLG